VKKCEMSAVGSVIFKSSSRGSSISSMSMMGGSGGMGGSGTTDGFTLLELGAGSEATSDVVGETTMMLS
jgi:hypothetical protein